MMRIAQYEWIGIFDFFIRSFLCRNLNYPLFLMQRISLGIDKKCNAASIF